jgi:hypothetical protein
MSVFDPGEALFVLSPEDEPKLAHCNDCSRCGNKGYLLCGAGYFVLCVNIHCLNVSGTFAEWEQAVINWNDLNPENVQNPKPETVTEMTSTPHETDKD